MSNQTLLRTLAVALVSLGCSASIYAQAAAPGPLVATSKGLYSRAKNMILRSAEKMPEEKYSFRPTPEVRTFGQMLGHVADAQYLFCSAVAGVKAEPKNVEKTATTKAQLTAALKDAFGYCDAVFDKLTEADAASTVTFFGRPMSKVGVLDFNTIHTYEHYGNIVTYLRINKIVPPSSEPRK